MLSLCFQIEIINFDPNRRDLSRGGESGDLRRTSCFPQKLQLENTLGNSRSVLCSSVLLPKHQRGSPLSLCLRLADIVNILKWQVSHF